MGACLGTVPEEGLEKNLKPAMSESEAAMKAKKEHEEAEAAEAKAKKEHDEAVAAAKRASTSATKHKEMEEAAAKAKEEAHAAEEKAKKEAEEAAAAHAAAVTAEEKKRAKKEAEEAKEAAAAAAAAKKAAADAHKEAEKARKEKERDEAKAKKEHEEAEAARAKAAKERAEAEEAKARAEAAHNEAKREAEEAKVAGETDPGLEAEFTQMRPSVLNPKSSNQKSEPKPGYFYARKKARSSFGMKKMRMIEINQGNIMYFREEKGKDPSKYQGDPLGYVTGGVPGCSVEKVGDNECVVRVDDDRDINLELEFFEKGEDNATSQRDAFYDCVVEHIEFYRT